MAQLSNDVCVMVNLNHRCMETKVRYSDEELQEFRAIINDKQIGRASCRERV